MDVDIGSSSVARGVIGLVVGYITGLVIDMAVLIEVTHISPIFSALIRLGDLFYGFLVGCLFIVLLFSA